MSFWRDWDFRGGDWKWDRIAQRKGGERGRGRGGSEDGVKEVDKWMRDD